MTQSTHATLQQLAKGPQYNGNISALINDAIAGHLDRQKDVIGSRGWFQKTLRERLDTLEKQQQEAFRKLNEDISNNLAKLTQAIFMSGISRSSDSPSDSQHDSSASHSHQQMELLILEIHSILSLMLFAFSKILPSVTKEERLGNVEYLLNTYITRGQGESEVYDSTLKLAKKFVKPKPMTEEELLRRSTKT